LFSTALLPTELCGVSGPPKSFLIFTADCTSIVKF
jgi:hypothetical protein